MQSSEERMYIQSLSKFCKMQERKPMQKVVSLNSTSSVSGL